MDKQADAALRRAIGMLEAILLRQTVAHHQMLKIAEEKQQAIIKGDLVLLEKTVLEEKKLVAQIEDEEKRRLAVMPLVKSGLGADPKLEKLTDVIALMPEPERTNMTKVRDDLRTILEACQLKTRHNAELLKTSLEHVESFLRTITEASAPNKNYRRDGRVGGAGPNLFDRNA